MNTQKAFKEGYNSFSDLVGPTKGANIADSYVRNVAGACSELERNINKFIGYQTKIGQLKGDVFEYHAAGTFNINAAINDSGYRAIVDRSKGYASEDIRTTWGEDYGLKALYNGAASAKAQAISQFERFKAYQASSGRTDLTFEAFLSDRGLDPETVLKSDPIYNGQTRLIPSDQLEEAKNFLMKKIASKSFVNSEEAKRYQETLDMLTAKMKAPDGSESADVTTKELLDIAQKAKEGKYDASKDGFSTEELINIEHILSKGIKAGINAATITMVLKIAPEVYKCLDELINSGEIDEERLRNLGFAALSGTTEGFIRGFVSATITSACAAGIWGEALKSVDPQVVGALTVVVMNTLKDSFLLAKGSITNNEFTYNLQRNLFVTACGLGGGALLQLWLPIFPFAYLLGNFVGSMVGSFAYIAFDNAILSFCVSSGSTFFGLVDQNYELPKDVIKKIGISVFDYEDFLPKELSYNEYTPFTYSSKNSNPLMIKILRRGVIGVRQIGFV